MAVVRNVYLSEFKSMPYADRLYYLLSNEIKIPIPNMGNNPLYWCAMDFVDIAKFLLTVIMSPIILAIAMNEARLLKSRYINECDFLFLQNKRMMK